MRVLILSLTMLFTIVAVSETRTLNPDGTTTIVYEPGERAAILEAAAQRDLDAMAARMAERRESVPSGQISDSSVTRAASSCEEVTTPEGVLKICNLTAGGAYGDTTVYLINGHEYDGRVRKNRDGSYTLTPNGSLEEQALRRGVYSGPQLPSQFNCNDNGEEFQCLVCSCFFEARGQSFPERVRIGRTKFSRVLNHNFENNVCGVVHEVMPAGGAAYSWTSKTSADRFTTRSGEQKRHVDVILGEGSPDLGEVNKRSFRGCVQASSEALQYRNKYFASYYWTKNLEGSPGWITSCINRADGMGGNLISGVTGSTGEEFVFAHNFRRICEVNGHRDERYLLDIDQSPYAPYRSVRPASRPARAID